MRYIARKHLERDREVHLCHQRNQFREGKDLDDEGNGILFAHVYSQWTQHLSPLLPLLILPLLILFGNFVPKVPYGDFLLLILRLGLALDLTM